jgi:hypothetical protein
VGEEGLHVHGLLHLAVLAIAVAGGYIGLDKLGHEKFQSAFDSIAPGAATELEETKQILMSLDLMQAETAILHPKYGMFYQYLICYITEIKYEIPLVFRIWYFLRRQKHIPLLGYFRHRWDVPTVFVMLTWCIVSFWFFVALTMDFGLPIKSEIINVGFFSYIFVIAWIFLMLASIQWKLQKIRETCEGCYHYIRNKMRPAPGRLRL